MKKKTTNTKHKYPEGSSESRRVRRPPRDEQRRRQPNSDDPKPPDRGPDEPAPGETPAIQDEDPSITEDSR